MQVLVLVGESVLDGESELLVLDGELVLVGESELCHRIDFLLWTWREHLPHIDCCNLEGCLHSGKHTEVHSSNQLGSLNIPTQLMMTTP